MVATRLEWVVGVVGVVVVVGGDGGVVEAAGKAGAGDTMRVAEGVGVGVGAGSIASRAVSVMLISGLCLIHWLRVLEGESGLMMALPGCRQHCHHHLDVLACVNRRNLV